MGCATGDYWYSNHAPPPCKGRGLMPADAIGDMLAVECASLVTERVFNLGCEL